MPYLLLFCSIVAAATFSTMNSIFSNKSIKGNRDFHFYNMIVSGAATIIFFVLSKGINDISIYSFLIGIIFAVIMVIAQFSTIKAFKYGPMSYTTMFNSCGMIIPSLAGVLFWNEKFSIFQIVGMIIVIISFVVGANFKRHSNINLRWLIYAILLLVFSGFMGVVQKIHQSSIHKTEKFSFLCTAFFIMCVFSAVMYFTSKKTSTSLKLNFKTISWCAIIGSLTAFNHAANLYLSGKMDSMFFFPVFNGSFTIACFVLSILVLREKLDFSQKLSFAFGVIGLIFLGLGI